MRMWNINPKVMCRKHLLGEHVEMHMFAGCLQKEINLQGYLDNQLVELHNLKKRHNLLAKEMKRRGYSHKSQLILPFKINAGYIDKEANFAELCRRCSDCLKLSSF